MRNGAARIVPAASFIGVHVVARPFEQFFEQLGGQYSVLSFCILQP